MEQVRTRGELRTRGALPAATEEATPTLAGRPPLSKDSGSLLLRRFSTAVRVVKVVQSKSPSEGSPFADGALIAKAADLGTFSGHRENSELLRKLNKRLKLFRGEDGWFARGRQGQVWEYGAGKLGFTVGTGVMISKAIEAGFVPTQRGDGEANFSCSWTDESRREADSVAEIAD